MIAKSFLDVAKNIRSNTRTVSISGILPRNGSFNNKALDVKDELLNMHSESRLDFITHKNINPRVDLNKSTLHLNRKMVQIKLVKTLLLLFCSITNEGVRKIV